MIKNPEGYKPLNFCTTCGNDFTSTEYFDRHRIGKFEYDFSIDKPDGRRCMNEEEMQEAGLSKVQIGDSPKYDKKLDFGVSLWWDREKAERTRTSFTLDSPAESCLTPLP